MMGRERSDKMILLFLRFVIIIYLLGLFMLLFMKLSHASKKNKGISSLFLFPLLVCTKKGRKALAEEIKNTGDKE